MQKNILTTAPSNPAIIRPLTKTTTMTLTTKRRGCRCGNATPTPGKLTCCGQRCPCYVDSKSCIGCKCRGCRNPHRPDGNKVRPVIPELACYEIQMADDHSNINELPIATSSNNSNISLALNSSTATMTASSISSNPTLIPLRNIHITQSSVAPPSTSLSTITTTVTQASVQPAMSLSSKESCATTTVTSAGATLMLDHMQRESVLIQNSEGKFQGK